MPKFLSPASGRRSTVIRSVAGHKGLLHRFSVRLAAGACLVTLACSCEKAPEPPPPPPPTPTPTPKPKPTPTPTPTPTPAPTPKPTPTPTPTPVLFAPEGTFYLMDDMSVRLPAGLLGVVAGTKVQMLKDNGDTMHVTDGHDEFDVKKSQLTNELAIATRIRRASDASAAADERAQAQQEAIKIKQEHDEIEYLRTHPLATPTPSPRH